MSGDTAIYIEVVLSNNIYMLSEIDSSKTFIDLPLVIVVPPVVDRLGDAKKIVNMFKFIFIIQISVFLFVCFV